MHHSPAPSEFGLFFIHEGYYRLSEYILLLRSQCAFSPRLLNKPVYKLGYSGQKPWFQSLGEFVRIEEESFTFYMRMKMHFLAYSGLYTLGIL